MRKHDGSPERPHDFKNDSVFVHRMGKGMTGASAYIPEEVYEMFFNKLKSRNPNVKGPITRFINRAVVNYIAEGNLEVELSITKKYKSLGKDHLLDVVC